MAAELKVSPRGWRRRRRVHIHAWCARDYLKGTEYAKGYGLLHLASRLSSLSEGTNEFIFLAKEKDLVGRGYQ